MLRPAAEGGDWCGRRDSNPHILRWQDLNLLRLPVPPRPLTRTAGSAGVTGWQVSWTFGGGQTLSQVWGGTSAASGSSVTVRNEAWNGRLQPNATASFGFIASGATTTPALTCTAR